MPSKTIEICLAKINERNTLIFKFEDEEISINLESNDTNNIKSVFRKIAKELCENKIQLNYSVDKDSIDKSKDGLFIDASQEYIDRLKQEIAGLEEDEHLKIIRASQVQDD